MLIKGQRLRNFSNIKEAWWPFCSLKPSDQELGKDKEGTFWSKVGEMGVGETGVGEQGISLDHDHKRFYR